MRVIQVPMSEMLCPPKKSRKLRCRSARHACEGSRRSAAWWGASSSPPSLLLRCDRREQTASRPSHRECRAPSPQSRPPNDGWLCRQFRSRSCPKSYVSPSHFFEHKLKGPSPRREALSFACPLSSRARSSPTPRPPACAVCPARCAEPSKSWSRCPRPPPPRQKSCGCR
jgi:hypothetical protein